MKKNNTITSYLGWIALLASFAVFILRVESAVNITLSLLVVGLLSFLLPKKTGLSKLDKIGITLTAILLIIIMLLYWFYSQMV